MAPVETAYRWTGFYIGGTISSVSSTMSTGAFPYQTAAGSGDVYDFGFGDATQAAIGGVLGYNYQMGWTVIGIEGDVNYKYGKGLFAPLDALPWQMSVATGGRSTGRASSPTSRSPSAVSNVIGARSAGSTVLARISPMPSGASENHTATASNWSVVCTVPYSMPCSTNRRS